MKTKIIGVTGRAGAGKDTVCDMAVAILAKHNIKAQKRACAAPLKEMCAKIFGYAASAPNWAFDGSQDQKNIELETVPGWTGRKILQHIGTEGFRHIYPDVWANYMFYSALETLNTGENRVVFISDVRFLSESGIIQRQGGLVVRVRRPEADDTTDNQGLKGHASELELTDIREDYCIDNQGRPLEYLEQIVCDMLEDFALIPPRG